jgi:YhcH/YjgK/YiaL family protein
MSVIIKTVTTKRDFKAFARFANRLYKGNKYYVPSMPFDDLNTFDRNKNGAYEAHEKWIDVQIVLSGEEYVRCAKRNVGELKTEYNPNNDALFMTVAGNYDNLCLYKGNFAVFFPDDLHLPGLAINNSMSIKKYVFKVRVK